MCGCWNPGNSNCDKVVWTCINKTDYTLCGCGKPAQPSCFMIQAEPPFYLEVTNKPLSIKQFRVNKKLDELLSKYTEEEFIFTIYWIEFMTICFYCKNSNNTH